MPWDGSSNAGFTRKGVRPWLPLPPDAATSSVAAQAARPDSMLALTRSLLAMRRAHPALQRYDNLRFYGADDPAVLKEIVYEMRFDEVSAQYADFGPFVTGLLLEPADALGRVGMPSR